MMQKVVVGLLVLTVIGAAAIGIYDSSRSDEPAGATELLAQDALTEPSAASQTDPTPTPAASTSDPAAAADAAAPGTPVEQQVQQQQALDQIGEPWQDSGMITDFDQNGMFLSSAAAGAIYVELGPPQYWQAQPVVLAVGDTVTVEGFYNGEQYHAVAVTKADGTQLVVRTADGLPLWSGGAQNGNGSGSGSQDEPIVAPDEWVTVEGTVTDYTGSVLTLQTTDGKTLTVQLGQPRFVEQQGITFAVGDAVNVLGFWQMEQFKAGEIVKTATGERLMLLDPNGRPLWGGPGRSGEQGGGSGNQGGGQGQGNGGQDQTATDQGAAAPSSGGQGNGRGYQGGRNQPASAE